MQAWGTHDPTLTRPIAAPLEQCAELLGVDLETRLGLHDPGPYPAMTRDQMRESLELLPSWVLAQKAAAQPPAHRGHAPAAGG